MNPVRVRPLRGKKFHAQIRYLQGYPWSSLGGYLDAQAKEPWISYDAVLGQIGGSRKRYREYVAEGIRSGYPLPWDRVKGQMVLGEERFIERLKRRINKRGSRRELPALRDLVAREPAAVVSEVARYFGLAEKQLTGKYTGYRDERALAMELLYRHANVRQEQIGKVLGQLGCTSVSRERARLRQKLEQKSPLGRALRDIETKLRS